MRSSRQLELHLSSWGGRRSGAGRKPASGRRNVTHRPRPAHEPRHPVHVTMRRCSGLPSLRGERVFVAMQRAFAAASDETFRVLHFSVQADHVHLLVEADASVRLSSGMRGLAIRAVKAINRSIGRRGAVWADRFHARPLSTPREVRNALVYGLQNWRKNEHNAVGIDPCSSAEWFVEWREGMRCPRRVSPLASPRTWLLRTGWRRSGRIAVDDGPRRLRS
jgi:REP-associated tyrosine transposase